MPVFLFTDIENSTKWWNSFPAEMGEILARHDILITKCVVRHNGLVVKNTGDGIFAVFEKGSPLACSLEIQEIFAQQDWSPLPELRIRIALNFGQAEQRGSDYFGSAVNRSSRLLNIGWGGQILLTESTLTALEGSEVLPPDAWIEDHGLHMLKDLSEPLHIYGLLYPTLPIQKFPPLRSLSRHMHNLPAQITPFFGREQELAKIDWLCNQSSCRLLTLIGPGGVGKTRLALQVAADQIDQFTHGVYLVQLAPLTSADSLAAAIGEALHINLYNQLDPTRQIQDFLREKKILLLMDNFEHVLSGSVLLSSLLASAPNLQIIVTSREKLNLQGEYIIEVQGMLFPSNSEDLNEIKEYSAVQLFNNSAQRVDPGFEINESNHSAILRICQLVSGNPLGLELASSWVRALSCQEIAIEIERNLDFLESSLRDLPERHQSLRAVFDYSWDLLSEEERRILRRLSVFLGGFDREAARFVTNASVLNISAFLDKSLLRRSHSERFEMLEIMRQYAEKKLAEVPETWDKTHNLHCEYYLSVLQRKENDLQGEAQHSALEEIRRDLLNVRAAWEWAATKRNRPALEKSLSALFTYYETRGLFREGEEIFRKALHGLSQTGSIEEDIFASKVLARLGWFAFRTGQYRYGREMMEASLNLARVTHSEPEIAFALSILGSMYQMLGDFTVARPYLEESIQLYSNINQPLNLAFSRHILGLVLLETGSSQAAKEQFEASLQTFRELKNAWGTARVLNSLGTVVQVLGDYEQARQFRLQSLEICQQIDDRRGLAVALNNLGDLLCTTGGYDDCLELMNKAISISREIGDRRMTAIFLNNLGLIHFKHLKDNVKAYDFYQESLNMFAELDDRRGSLFTNCDLAAALIDGEKPLLARTHLERALRIAVDLENPKLILYVLTGYLNYEQAINNPNLAQNIAHIIFNHPASDQEILEKAAQYSSIMDKTTGVSQANTFVDLQSHELLTDKQELYLLARLLLDEPGLKSN